MTRPQALDQAVQDRIRDLALTLRPSTVYQYAQVFQEFLDYIRTVHPEVEHASQLRRRPHIVDWLRDLAQRRPPLKATTRTSYIIKLRRLLTDVIPDAIGGPLFIRGDLPPQDRYLPRPLSPEDDSLLQQQLRKEDTLYSNAFLLTRMTGLRIGECRALHTDSLQHLGGSDWALRVPLGKLHNDRWVPVDDELRRVFDRILQLRAGSSPGMLLTLRSGRVPCYSTLNINLAASAQRAGCSQRVTPHQLRHTFATTMLRNGVSLLAVKEMLGHRCLEMTMRYVLVSQVDLQREYHKARQNMALRYALPKRSRAGSAKPALRRILDDAGDLMEMLRRDTHDSDVQRRLNRLTQRLTRIAGELAQMGLS
jgi:site-specific recombinase XerD